MSEFMESCQTCGQPLLDQIKEKQGNGWKMSMGSNQVVMAQMPSNSVGAVITDPPYGSGGMTTREMMKFTKDKYVGANAKYKDNLPDFAGDSLPESVWKEIILSSLAQTSRVLKPQSFFAFFIDWRHLPQMTELIFESGLRLRGCLVWDKGNASRPYKGGFRMQAEYILWGGNRLPRDDVYQPGIIKATTKTNGKKHLTEKPVALMEELIACVAPGDLVVDPFAGSSSTGVACLKHGLQYHGIEVVPEYFDISVERLQGTEAELCQKT